jgi:hypothetical protein
MLTRCYKAFVRNLMSRVLRFARAVGLRRELTTFTDFAFTVFRVARVRFASPYSFWQLEQ